MHGARRLVNEAAPFESPTDRCLINARRDVQDNEIVTTDEEDRTNCTLTFCIGDEFRHFSLDH